MAENNDDFFSKFSRFADKTMKTLESTGKTAWDRLDVEKQKAEIRSEINANQRELSSAYEKLGKEYYEKEKNGSPIEDQQDLFDLIQNKTKSMDVLKEKLKQFD